MCGGRFHRRIADGGYKWQKPVWRCHTFDSRGKNYCRSRQIPEEILVQKTMEILGVAKLDRATILNHIREIRVPEPDRLIYVFCDGQTKETVWEYPSRSENWTEEMKKAASIKRLKNKERSSE